MSKTRQPDEAERALWQTVRQQCIPLKRKHAAPKSPEQIVAELTPIPNVRHFKPRPPIAPPPPTPQTRAEAVAAPKSSQGLDLNTQKRLLRGQIPIEARLDLHGFKLEQGRRELRQFLARAYLAQMRCVLVITGKGRNANLDDEPPSPHAANMRSELPRWLQETDIAKNILAVTHAIPRDGGNGAWYILLRRQRLSDGF